MRKILCFLLVLCCLLSACSPVPESIQKESAEKSEYANITEIDHAVLEPDQQDMLSDTQKKIYRDLVEAVIRREPSVALSDDENENAVYMEFFKQNPYCFLTDSCEIKNSALSLRYAYSEEDHGKIVEFMDKELLRILNFEARENDNDLDHMLKIYLYITGNYKYDSKRKDNKQLDSPLFDYPGDEVFKMLRDKKGLCFGFAYVLRFCFLQYGIKCFNVRGYSEKSKCGHMWNLFEYDGCWFNCDSGWDISDEGYSKLMHFGKTDNEREVDSLDQAEYKKERFKYYGDVSCTDERFKIFRGIRRYAFIIDHEYFMVDTLKEEKVFNSETFEMR